MSPDSSWGWREALKLKFGNTAGTLHYPRWRSHLKLPVLKQPEDLLGQEQSAMGKLIHLSCAFASDGVPNAATKHHAGDGLITFSPEPSYSTTTNESGEGPALFEYRKPFPLDIKESPGGGVLPEFSLAFETWGNLSATGDNAILLHTGLSASAHAASSAQNPAPGWYVWQLRLQGLFYSVFTCSVY